MTPEQIIYTILVFFVLVSIHEWGHFYFAKRAGILVREFAIGFGPKVFSYKKGETRYTLRLLPLGGYVRMAGEDPEVVQVNPGQTIAVGMENGKVSHIYLDQLDSRTDVIRGVVDKIDLERELRITMDVDGDMETYQVHPAALMIAKDKETQIAPLDRQFGSKTVGQRALSIFAGPFMNFILAFLLFVIFVALTGVDTNKVEIGTISNLEIGGKTITSPAKSSDLLKGDIVDQVNGIKIGNDRNKMIDLIEASPGKTMVWTVIREGQTKEIELTPLDVEGKGKVGVEIRVAKRSASATETVTGSWDMMSTFTKEILIGFKKLVTFDVKMDDMGGPVRIVEVTGQFADQGVHMVVFWAGILSLYLGLFNLLPFPALDGSRLTFLAIEAIRGKPIDPNRESLVHFIGFAMLMLLMIAVTYNDILRLFKG